jgi:hypothetical protein
MAEQMKGNLLFAENYSVLETPETHSLFKHDWTPSSLYLQSRAR